MEDGNYAADVTGYLVNVMNFDLTLIDIPTAQQRTTRRWSGNGTRT